MQDKSVTITIHANATQLAAAMQACQASVKSAEAAVKSSASGFSQFANKLSEGFSSAANAISNFGRIAGTVFLGGAFGAGVLITSASQLQSMRASFESMTGSAESAVQVLGQLNKFSYDTAFSSDAINAAARTLLGAGLAVDDLGKRMQQIGDIAGATGADLGRLTLPLSQALARGKLQTEDFYQILDSGAGKLGQVLRQEVADRGMGDLQEAMEKGRVTADILFATIEKATAQGGFAFEGAIKQSQTFDGRMSNLKETITSVGLEVLGVDRATGNIDKNGVFAKVSAAIQDATQWLSSNKETIKSVAGVILDNLVPGVAALTSVFIVAQIAATAFGIAGAVAAGAVTWPIVAIVAAVALVVGALIYLQLKFNIFGQAWNMITAIWGGMSAWFSSVFTATWNAITSVFGALGEWFAGVWNGITATFNGVADFFGGMFNAAWNNIVNAFSGIGGFFSNMWDQITSIFGSVGTVIGDAIGGAVKGVVNSILGFAESTINGFLSAINIAIDTMNAIPGVSIGRLDMLNIPRLASGGIVSATPGGQMVTVAEGGQDEWVVPEGKMASLVRQLNAASGGGRNVTQNFTFNITVENDGTDFSQAQAENMAKKIATAVRSQGLTISEMGALR